ncbi:hypothetical protein RFI_10112 [Reticulomyxa filosa]|uniref:Uncharacterized protein n=1 Tax=Reticulomyxa filosa TaxID=46433 RepID=X6NM75_RETFI|nr:hypothetical protein RFI_10112 [Reticulomyxa filosa]|eukprot:ETO27018.1 hypothetical protein RFI_10112 [Reticulomyxa filosa]
MFRHKLSLFFFLVIIFICFHFLIRKKKKTKVEKKSAFTVLWQISQAKRSSRLFFLLLAVGRISIKQGGKRGGKKKRKEKKKGKKKKERKNEKLRIILFLQVFFLNKKIELSIRLTGAKKKKKRQLHSGHIQGFCGQSSKGFTVCNRCKICPRILWARCLALLLVLLALTLALLVLILALGSL